MSTPAEDEHRSIQSRLHDPGRHFPELGPLAGTMTKAIRNGSVSNITIGLVQLRAGQLAGSTYHTVRQTGLLRKAGESEKRIVALTSWRDAPYFTEAERVALDLVEAVLAPLRRANVCPTDSSPRPRSIIPKRRCGH